MDPSRAVAHLWRELGDALRDAQDLTQAVDAYDRGLRMLGLAGRLKPAHQRAGTTESRSTGPTRPRADSATG
jgi:cytochrome c-type biogenesis protein CcmH/NrfG